jgi:hypothetical protein
MNALVLTLVLAQTSPHPFSPIAKVLLHPRCLNCHPAGDAPLQGDDSRPHRQNVRRALEGLGTKCTACHLEQGLRGPHLPPAAASWEMPSHAQPMIFEGRSEAALCVQLKARAQNGNRTLAALRSHMQSDPRVLWSFNPGPLRSPPPLTHPEFLARVDEWIRAGAPCPEGASR